MRQIHLRESLLVCEDCENVTLDTCYCTAFEWRVKSIKKPMCLSRSVFQKRTQLLLYNQAEGNSLLGKFPANTERERG